ncbi:acyltransferase [Dyadobacter tibetensis]|uniref:acyltransferase n=1 Tax=Dyadobacter tibetensis TaxID=1211851 RepID=UPI0004712376|nr:acyltransferase [Dyadobacter tibetensis]
MIKNLIILFNSLKRVNLFRSLFLNILINGNHVGKNKILVYGNSWIRACRSSRVEINKGIFRFNSGSSVIEPFPGLIELQENSRIIIQNGFSIKSGSHIILSKDAQLTLGSGFINRFAKIRCFKEINIGHNVAISENVTIWDSDAHELVDSTRPKAEPITIGNNVWIGLNVTILKGVTIGDGSIIGAGSVVNKSIPENCLAAGVPAKVIKRNIQWKF